MVAHPPAPVSDRARLGPDSRTEAWRWFLIACFAFLVGQATALILATAGAAIAGVHGGVTALARLDVPPAWFVATELVGVWVGFGGAAWMVTRGGRSVGLSVRRHDVWFLWLGAGLQLVIGLVYLPFHVKGMSKAADHLLGGGTGWVLVIVGFMTIVLVPIFEELFFRGVLLRALLVLCATRRAIVGVVISVLLDGTVFGFAHLGVDSWIELPGLIAVGVVLSVLAIKTGRLGPSIMTHAGFNAVAVVVFAYQR